MPSDGLSAAPGPAPGASPFAAGAAAGAGGQPPGPGGVSITSDETNNALVILATARQYESILAALRRLDVLPLQVLIEAAVTEVTLGDDLRFGLQWALRSGNQRFFLNNPPQIDTINEAQARGITGLTDRGSITGSTLDIGVPLPSFGGFSYVYTAPSVTVVLEALSEITTVNVLSSPQLLVLNNQTAMLQVGDQVPVQTQSAQSTIASNAPIVSSVDYRDTGVILRVTPRVNESGVVLLDIAQEVSDVVQTSSSSLNTPTIQQRRIASTVAVRDGQTIGLGGLIRDNRRTTRSGVPVLMDIPVLGGLFRRSVDTGGRTELLVLLTPRVIRSSADAQGVTEELRQRIRQAAPPVSPIFPPAISRRRSVLPPTQQ
jgi:general secretion pathway protein D